MRDLASSLCTVLTGLVKNARVVAQLIAYKQIKNGMYIKPGAQITWIRNWSVESMSVLNQRAVKEKSKQLMVSALCVSLTKNHRMIKWIALLLFVILLNLTR